MQDTTLKKEAATRANVYVNAALSYFARADGIATAAALPVPAAVDPLVQDIEDGVRAEAQAAGDRFVQAGLTCFARARSTLDEVLSPPPAIPVAPSPAPPPAEPPAAPVPSDAPPAGG